MFLVSKSAARLRPRLFREPPRLSSAAAVSPLSTSVELLDEILDGKISVPKRRRNGSIPAQRLAFESLAKQLKISSLEQWYQIRGSDVTAYFDCAYKEVRLVSD